MPNDEDDWETDSEPVGKNKSTPPKRSIEEVAKLGKEAFAKNLNIEDEPDSTIKPASPLNAEPSIAKPIQTSIIDLLKELNITASFTNDNKLKVVYPKSINLLETIRINKVLEEHGLKGQIDVEKVSALMKNEAAKAAFKNEVKGSGTQPANNMTELRTQFVTKLAEQDADKPDTKPTILRAEAQTLDEEATVAKPVKTPVEDKISAEQGFEYFLNEDSPFFSLVKLEVDVATAERTFGKNNVKLETLELFTAISPDDIENSNLSNDQKVLIRQELEALEQALVEVDLRAVSADKASDPDSFSGYTKGTGMEDTAAFVMILDRKEIAKHFVELSDTYKTKLADIKERDIKLAAEELNDEDEEESADLEDEETFENVYGTDEVPPAEGISQEEMKRRDEQNDELPPESPPVLTRSPVVPQETTIPQKRKELKDFTEAEINSEMSKIKASDLSDKDNPVTKYNLKRLEALNSELEKREQAKAPQATPVTVQQPDNHEELKQSIIEDKKWLETDDKSNKEETKKREENIAKARGKLLNKEAPGKHLRGLQEGREKAKEMVEGAFADAAKISNPYEQLAAYIVALFAAIFAGLGMLANKGLEKLEEQRFKQIQPHLHNLEKLSKQKASLEEKIANLKDEEPLTPREQENLKKLEEKLKRCDAGIKAHQSLIERMATQKEAKAESKIEAAETKLEDANALKKSADELLAYCDTAEEELKAQLEQEKDNPDELKEINAQLEEIGKTRKDAEKTSKEQEKIINAATQELEQAKKDKDTASNTSKISASLGATGPGGVGLGQPPAPNNTGTVPILTTTNTPAPTKQQVVSPQPLTRGVTDPVAVPVQQGAPVVPLFTQTNGVGTLAANMGNRVGALQAVLEVQPSIAPTVQPTATPVTARAEGETDDLEEEKQEEELDEALGEDLDEKLEKHGNKVDLEKDEYVSKIVFGGAAKAKTEAAKNATLAEMDLRIAEPWPVEEVEIDDPDNSEEPELDENEEPIPTAKKIVKQPVELAPQLKGEANEVYKEQYKDNTLESALNFIKDRKDVKEMRSQLQFLLRGARQEVMDLKQAQPLDKEAIEMATRKMMALEKMEHMFATMKAMNKSGQQMSEEQYKIHWAKIHTILTKAPPIVQPGYIGQLKTALENIDKANVYRPPVTRLGKAGEALAKPGKAMAAKVRESPVVVKSDDNGKHVQLNLSYNRARIAGTVGVFEQHKNRKTKSGAIDHMKTQIADGLTIAMNQYGKGSAQNPINITYIPPERPQPEAALAMLMELKERAMKSGQPIHLIHPETNKPMVISPQRELSPDESSCFNHFANQRPIVGARMGAECAGYTMLKNIRDEDGKILDKDDKKGGSVDFTAAINIHINTKMNDFDMKNEEKINKVVGINPDKPKTRLAT
ncbi:MAG: hypothetical protein HYX61_02470 [Gammaproteobacteria bacterium]|jgi:hypothetical protein|nr:hypothetical protein [Gammaproteobacteria bacterium]